MKLTEIYKHRIIFIGTECLYFQLTNILYIQLISRESQVRYNLNDIMELKMLVKKELEYL